MKHKGDAARKWLIMLQFCVTSKFQLGSAAAAKYVLVINKIYFEYINLVYFERNFGLKILKSIQKVILHVHRMVQFQIPLES